MKNEKDMIRTLFDEFLPDEGQIARMERNIAETHKRADKGTGRKLRLMPILAAALVMTVGITAAAAAVAAPVIKRYFYPGVGVVEMDAASAEPLYMLVDQDCDNGTDFTCLYGIWQDNSARFLFSSQTRYEDISADVLFGDDNAELKHMGASSVDGNPLNLVSKYRVTYSDVTWEEAAAGLPLGEHTVPFTRMAAEYRTYSVEECGLHLELIPLTDDLTTFAAEISYLDGHDTIDLEQRANYIYQNPYDAMALVDALGNTYPLKERQGGDFNIFSITETPAAEIVGFRADYLAFTRDFSWDGESVTVELPLPADGEAMDVGLEFVFPDGVTKGMVSKVGYNTSLRDTQHSDYHSDTDEKMNKIYKENFPMGFYAVVTEAVEQNGIQYWTELFYTDDYYAYLEPYYDENVRSPYDTETEWAPMTPRHSVSTWSLENAVQHTEHYIPDGRDTVTMKADRYSAIAYGDWDIDFRAAASETAE